MTQVETRPVPAAEGTTIYVQWGPVIAGAIAMAALATVLHSFAAGVGLALISPVPTWRDASIALVLLTGLYLLRSWWRSPPTASAAMSPAACARG